MTLPYFRCRGMLKCKVLITSVISYTLVLPYCRMLIFYSFTDSGVAAIPSESAVLAAKEKRERMRTTGFESSQADEYISLSLTTRDDGYQGPHPETRLMREDDDLGEGDDGVFI
jgi:hypothetical protein